MSNTKRFFSLTLIAFFIASAVAAQDAGGGASGGGTQRQNRLDINSIKDITDQDGLDRRNKLLKDIREAVAKGDTGDDIYAALEYMSKEGWANKTNNQGRPLNDYPTIRQEVARELGKMGTAKAADILIQVCRNETIPDVQCEAINALGNIGLNENDRTVDAIFTVNKLQRYNGQPVADDDFRKIVNSAIDAFDKIDKKNDGLGNKSKKKVQEFLDNISKKQFRRYGSQVPTHERAKKVLEEMLRRESQRRQGS